jgi:hypothetical protein
MSPAARRPAQRRPILQRRLPPARAYPANLNRRTAEVSRLSAHFMRGRDRGKTGGLVAHITGPAKVVAAEFGGRTWRTVVSSDGVVSEISTWRPRALQDSHQVKQQHGRMSATSVTENLSLTDRGPDTTPKEMSSPLFSFRRQGDDQ